MMGDLAVHAPCVFPRKFERVQILLATKLSNYYPNVRLAEHQQDGLPRNFARGSWQEKN